MPKARRRRARPPMHALAVGVLVVVTCLAPPPARTAVATPLPGAAAAPEFFLEKIVVERAERFTPEIIVSESLLEPGRSYTERQLRDAVHRIVRLPLVLDADFALRKGSERGRYELVITVEETRRWFFGWDLLVVEGDDLFFIEGLDSPEEPDDLSLFVGWRVAAGRHGVFNVAVDPLADGTAQVGYTQYDLLGRNIQLSVNYLVEPIDPEVLDEESRTARLSLGVPIRGNHSILLAGSRRTGDFRLDLGTGQAIRRDNERVVANLSWVYNSVDDPIFPTSGWFVRGGVEYRDERQRDQRTVFDITGDLIRISIPTRTESRRLVLAGDRYWALNDRDALSLSVDLSGGRAEVDDLFLGDVTIDAELDLWEAGLTVGYSRFVWRDQRRPRWRQLRWESELEGFHEGTSPDFSLPWNPRYGYRLGTGFRFRSTWGVFRARFDYLEALSGPDSWVGLSG